MKLLSNFSRNTVGSEKLYLKKMFNKEIPHNWLSLLAPLLLEYFAQMEYWMASGNYPIYIMHRFFGFKN